MEADGVDKLAIWRSCWLQDQVKLILSEHGAAEVHKNYHDNNLIERMQSDLSPELRIHNEVFPADSCAGRIRFVRLSSESDGPKNVHDQVAPEHLHDVKRSMADSCPTQDRDRAKYHVDSQLELDEFPNVVMKSSSPFDGSVD